MTKTVNVWRVTGSPAFSLGNISEYYTATLGEAKRVVKECELSDPVYRKIEVGLNRYGIANALQGIIDDHCINEH